MAGAQRQPRRGEALADVLMTLYHWAARRVGRLILSLSSRFSGGGNQQKTVQKRRTMDNGDLIRGIRAKQANPGPLLAWSA